MDSTFDFELGSLLINNNAINSSSCNFNMKIDCSGLYRFSSDTFMTMLNDDAFNSHNFKCSSYSFREPMFVPAYELLMD